jgi:hypothetical protein
MPKPSFLIDERKPLVAADQRRLREKLVDAGPGTRSVHFRPTLAISLHDVVIHDNRKWFGGADLRLDALVVTGYGELGEPKSFYMPKTASFPGVKDGERLAIGEGGLLLFHGLASHFLALMIMVSRNRKDTDDLAELLSAKLQTDQAQSAVGTLMQLVAGASATVVGAAMGAAGVLGEVAYRALRSANGDTIGLYRNTHLEHRDRFGIGHHPDPPRREYRAQDLSFRYEIHQE